jgi:hypothetical protein
MQRIFSKLPTSINLLELESSKKKSNSILMRRFKEAMENTKVRKYPISARKMFNGYQGHGSHSVKEL